MLARIAAALALALLGTVVAGGCSAPKPKPGQVVVRGQLTDASTGKPVPRDEIFVHFFCDAVKHQTSLERENRADYEVVLPAPTVRVRVFDPTGRYRGFEQTVTVQGQGLDYDIPLQPTGYVLLRVQVIDDHTGLAMKRPAPPPGNQPPAVGSGGPLFSFYSEGGEVHRGYLSADAAGIIEVRVPRAPLRILSVNSPLGVSNGELDLTDCEDAEFTYDLRMK